MSDDHEKLLIDADSVAAMLSIGKSKLWQLHSARMLPKPVRLPSCRRTLWRKSDIERWVHNGCLPICDKDREEAE